MPITRADDNCRIAQRIELARDLFFGRGECFLLDRLTFAILRVEYTGELRSFLLVVRDQQAQGTLGGIESPRCIQARTKFETDVIRADV